MNASEVALPAGHRITRFYTLARRFPTLIGRLPNGSELPYGPYTVGQFVTAVALLVGGYWTLPLWGGERGLLVNGPVLFGVTAGVVMFLRKVPWRGRGPVPMARGAVGAYSASGSTYKGKALPALQATHVRGRVLIADEHVMAAAAELQAQRHAVSAVAQAHRSSPAPSPHQLTTRKDTRNHQRGASTSARSTSRPASAALTAATSAPVTVTRTSLSGVQRLRQQASTTASTAPGSAHN